MYLEYLVGAIGLIPIYIFLIRKLNLKLSTALNIYFYRGLFSIAYITYANYDYADVNTYIRGGSISKGIIGSSLISSIVDLSGKYLGIKGYTLYSLFGLLGTVGCCYLYCSIKKCEIKGTKKISLISKIFCFLPALSFWTCAPGKDSIIFLVITYGLYSYLKLNDNSFKVSIKIIITAFLLLLIRPHVGASLALGYIIFFTNQIKKKKYLYIRVIILLIVSVTFWISIPLLLDFVGIGSNNILDGLYLLEERFSQTSIQEVNTSSNYIMRIIFFLFTPLPLISLNPLYLADYINTFFITYYLFTIIKGQKSYRNIINNPFFLFSVILIFVLPLTIYNQGIASRQKWMVLPPLIVSLKNNIYLNNKKIVD
tara:strand:+ start:12516 stop:13622 length:1107 start_codon:yes stop_codon:yes gene_type:complete